MPSSPSSSSHPTPNSGHPSKKIIFLSASYALFFLGMLAFAYHGQLPIGWITRFHNADKIGHLVLYFIPSYLGHKICRHKHFSQWHLPVFPSLFALFTIAEELSQGLSANRTLDGLDMVCSLVGIGCGYWISQRQYKKQLRNV